MNGCLVPWNMEFHKVWPIPPTWWNPTKPTAGADLGNPHDKFGHRLRLARTFSAGFGAQRSHRHMAGEGCQPGGSNTEPKIVGDDGDVQTIKFGDNERGPKYQKPLLMCYSIGIWAFFYGVLTIKKLGDLFPNAVHADNKQLFSNSWDLMLSRLGCGSGRSMELDVEVWKWTKPSWMRGPNQAL